MKKVRLFLAVIILINSMVIITPQKMQAASMTEDQGFKIDEKLFNVQWYESQYIYVKVDRFTNNSKIFSPQVTTLGKAKITIGVATTKYAIDNKVYQKILVKAEMLPSNITGKYYGMSQYLTVKVSVYDNMKNVYIEPKSSEGTTGYSISGTSGLNFNGGVSKSSNGCKLDGGVTYSLSTTSTTSYTQGSLNVITNRDIGGFAEWDYDYISSVNKAQNAYLFGSSTQYGVLSWNMGGPNECYNGFTLTVEATFGGGNISTNTRYKELFGGYNLGDVSITYKGIIKAYDPYKRSIVLFG